MICPFCGVDKDKVIDSRSADEGQAIRRRRECQACHKRFSTLERVEPITRLSVLKRDGSRMPFDRQKILDGLEKACYKRPVTADQMILIVEQVEKELFGRHVREVSSQDIGQAVAERLRDVDQVAYVRFASVYKQFREARDFLDEVRDVLELPPDRPEQGRLF